MTNNVLQLLTQSDNAIISLLAFLVLTLAGVVVFQWTYTTRSTVPKWAWDRLVDKIDESLKMQEQMLVIIKERLKR